MNFEQKFSNFKSNEKESRDAEAELEQAHLKLPTREEIDAAPSFASRDAFDRWVEQKKNTPAGHTELDNFRRLVEQTAGGPSAGIFRYIMGVEAENKNRPETEKKTPLVDPLRRLNEIQAEKLYEEDLIIGKMDIEDLSELLGSLDSETREFIFASRNHLKLRQAKAILDYRLKDTEVVYHTSPADIDFKKGLEGEVYFSTDIKRLYKAPGARFLYALRVPIKQIESSKYGALDCFGRLRKGDKNQPISDKINIYDSDRPGGNQKEIFDALGAGFSDYVPATGHAENFMKTYKSSSELDI